MNEVKRKKTKASLIDNMKMITRDEFLDILYYGSITAFISLAILNILESVIVKGEWILYAYIDGWGEQYIEMVMLFYILFYSIIKMKEIVSIEEQTEKNRRSMIEC